MAKANRLPASRAGVIPEEEHRFQVVKDFSAVNTKADRTAIKTEEFAWLENIIPQGFGNLQVVPTYSPLVFTWGAQSVAGGWFSCSLNTYQAGNVVLHDYIVAFLSDGSSVFYDATSASGSTVAAAGFFSTAGIQCAQWKNEFLLILDPVKGLFSWNVSAGLVNIGSVGLIVITNGGTGYTSPPTVTISAPVNGVRATALATLTSGVVTSITLTNAGSGYGPTGASPTITLSGGGGSGATAQCAIITFATGVVSSVTVTNGGTGYTANFAVTFSGGGGSGAAGLAITNGSAVTSVLITNTGSGYTSAPTPSFAAGAGTGATGTAVINNTPNSSIATFSGRVWVGAGRTVSYTAANQYNDFITVSAGSIILTDSTLRGSIVQMISANNFLYIFGDDSVNVFSDVNVQSNGSTLFTNTTVSSSIGTAFPQAIFNYFRSVLFMNQYGIYALVGATASKISDSLDGLFKNIDFTAPITSGQVVVNNQLCAAFNFRYNDPRTLTTRYIQAMYFEKKWWFASQDATSTRVLAAQTAGNLVMYGTAGSAIVQLFANTTSDIDWTIITALWPMEDVMRTKQALRYGIELRTGSQAVVLIVTVDYENGSARPQTIFNGVSWTNNANQIVAWVNNMSAIVQWIGTGYELYAADAEQYGKYLGLTILGSAPGAIITGNQIEYTLREVF